MTNLTRSKRAPTATAGYRAVWAVGTTDYARTLIQRWGGKSWSGPS